MAKLTWEDRMTIKGLIARRCSNRHIVRLLGVSEGTVRYHRRRQEADTVDGRSGQQPVAARFHGAIDAYVSASGDESCHAADAPPGRKGSRRRSTSRNNNAPAFEEIGSPQKFPHTQRLRQFENTNASWLHSVAVWFLAGSSAVI